MINVVHPDLTFSAPLVPRDMAGVDLEIVHHSAGPRTQSVAEIHAAHLGRGWIGVGYHYLIDTAGVVYQGRPIWALPAAAAGANARSVDLCLIGNFMLEEPTTAQISALIDLSVNVHRQVPAITRTIGHRDVATMLDDPSLSDLCPGDKLYDLLPGIIQAVRTTLGGPHVQ